MKSASTLSLGIMIAATCAGGQTIAIPAALEGAVATRPLSIDRSSCPLDLHVVHAGSLAQNRATYEMQGDAFPSIPAQRVRLTITNLLPREVVSAVITARGYSSNGRYLPLSGEPAPDVAKSVDLALPLKVNGSAARELSLSRFTAIAVIDIDEVTYANGSTWHALYSGACSVTPDLVMPVAALQ